MHSLKDLRNYTTWVGENPATILRCVKAHGGWAKVFPRNKPFPLWASRVRNCFNVNPKKLKLLDEKRASKLVARANRFGILEDPIARLALSGDVYIDTQGRFWYEMRAGGTVYHYKKRPGQAEFIKATLKGQTSTPVFKLISPDQTGGSCEVCINNWQINRSRVDYVNPIARGTRGTKRIGGVGQWVHVERKIVVIKELKGSYNYSETIRMGITAHKFRDVNPHSTASTFYVDPPPNWVRLETRLFPEKDRHGNVLADMI